MEIESKPRILHHTLNSVSRNSMDSEVKPVHNDEDNPLIMFFVTRETGCRLCIHNIIAFNSQRLQVTVEIESKPGSFIIHIHIRMYYVSGSNITVMNLYHHTTPNINIQGH